MWLKKSARLYVDHQQEHTQEGLCHTSRGQAVHPMRIPVRDYLRGFEQALKPGGMLVIYNLSPAQNSAKYLPMADGRSPFHAGGVATSGL